ncbi:hypothetical protein NSZ01_05010 [Nocardioides szechwanensis]|uniref:Uncharacterized protein n=1 Tax=Nocardioides szechwanensis TaxID=1005944 RepID=A0A1G9W5Q0_9ACTN|nr:hypothetical protein [Nocardioides szechwanensis]GEP32733.1 hypothetical protein NSZ01_05010 [Nocardioides szechwanensis]SDM79872.1 hypothetical protein SAMN05192576_0956 [Nocardioides szechwanensis]
MAHVTITPPDGNRITLPRATDDDAAALMVMLTADFERRGGAWVGGAVDDDGSRSAFLTWVPRTSTIQVTFDGPDLPAAAEDLLIHTQD